MLSHDLYLHQSHSRAARILSAWRAWRAERKLTPKRALEASALATMLFAWGVGYTVLCPAEPAHHVVQHVAQVRP